MQTYLEWCDDMERRYDTMPEWYWDEAKRRAAYEASLAPAAPDLSNVHPTMAAALGIGLMIAKLDRERDQMLDRGDKWWPNLSPRVFVDGHCQCGTLLERVPCGWIDYRFKVVLDNGKEVLAAPATVHPADNIAIFPAHVWIETAMRHALSEDRTPCA